MRLWRAVVAWWRGGNREPLKGLLGDDKKPAYPTDDD